MHDETKCNTYFASFFLFFFSHGKMASLTVQDVEVRAPKMICKKVIVLLQGSFYTKGFLCPLPG